MATKPVTEVLNADLPENWKRRQIVSPSGTEVGLTEQHGYNYLMAQVNAAQRAVTQINNAFSTLATISADGTIPGIKVSVDAITGVLPVSKGGTGRTALFGTVSLMHDLFSAASSGVTTGWYVPLFSGNWASGSYLNIQAFRNLMGLGNTLGALPIANGGTGATTVNRARRTLFETEAKDWTFLPVLGGWNPASNSFINGGYTAIQTLRGQMGLGSTLGVLPVANGGTGQNNLQALRNSLGLGNTLSALPIANGGTGAVIQAEAQQNLGITVSQRSSASRSAQIPIAQLQNANYAPSYCGTAKTTSTQMPGLPNGWYAFFYISHCDANGYGVQIAIGLDTQRLYARNSNGGAWNAWIEISTALVPGPAVWG